MKEIRGEKDGMDGKVKRQSRRKRVEERKALASVFRGLVGFVGVLPEAAVSHGDRHLSVQWRGYGW